MVAEAHVRGSIGRRVGALLLALLNLAGAAVVAFFGLLADGLRCDDNCSIAPGWRNDPNAWQWHGTLVVCFVVLGSAVALTVAVLTRRLRHLRAMAVGVQLAALVILALLSFTAAGGNGGWAYLVVLFAFFAATGAGSARSAPG